MTMTMTTSTPMRAVRFAFATLMAVTTLCTGVWAFQPAAGASRLAMGEGLTACGSLENPCRMADLVIVARGPERAEAGRVEWAKTPAAAPSTADGQRTS